MTEIGGISTLVAAAFTAISTLVSALAGVGVASWLTKRAAKLSQRRDVLSRLVGNRFVLTSSSGSDVDITQGEPFVALNEVCIAYADDRKVIRALEKMLDEINDEARMSHNLKSLIEEMTRSAKVPIRSKVHDGFFLKPFTPQPRRFRNLP